MHYIVINDQMLTLREFAKTIRISTEYVKNILTAHLDMKKSLGYMGAHN